MGYLKYECLEKPRVAEKCKKFVLTQYCLCMLNVARVKIPEEICKVYKKRRGNE